jgi:hypothetical protein
VPPIASVLSFLLSFYIQAKSPEKERTGSDQKKGYRTRSNFAACFLELINPLVFVCVCVCGVCVCIHTHTHKPTYITHQSKPHAVLKTHSTSCKKKHTPDQAKGAGAHSEANSMRQVLFLGNETAGPFFPLF